jgi:hypothetical protein
MSEATLYTLSAYAGILSGVSIFIGTLLTDLIKTSKGTLFNFLGALIGLFGVTGIYVWQSGEAGIFGLVAYVLIFIGLTLIACIDFWGYFFSPSLTEEHLAEIGKSSAMQVTYISFFIFLIGDLLFGLSVIMAGKFPVIASLLFTIGFIGTVFRPMNQLITFVGLTLSSIGLAWWCLTLISFIGGS